MLRIIGRNFLRRHARSGFIRHRNLFRNHRLLFIPGPIKPLPALLRHRLQVLVHGIHTGRSMHPAAAVVEPLINEKLPPRRCPVSIQPLFAHHLQFAAKEEGRMWINQQQRMLSRSIRRRNRHPVRPARLHRPGRIHHRLPEQSDLLRGVFSIKRFEQTQIHPFNIPADAAFRKAQGHPRLKMPDHAGLRLRMLSEVIIQPVRKRHHQLLQPRRTNLILRLQFHRIDEQLHPQIRINLAFALRLRQPPHRI